MVRNVKRIGWLLVALWLALPLHAQEAAAPEGWHRQAWAVMTTRAYLEFRIPAGTTAEPIVEAVRLEFERINAEYSPWREDSLLSRVNRNAYRKAVLLTPEAYALFTACSRFHSLTEGAFDASFAAAGQLYDFRAGVAPDDAALGSVRAGIGWQQVSLDHRRQTVRFMHPATRVDFGGIAKGHAIDRAVAILRARGVTDGYVALGGDSYALGERMQRPWMVGVRDPRDPARAPVLLPLSNLAVSTSGDYERYFERDGERIHHILSPGSGKPARGLRSVTVIADDSLTADALSTGLFVMGLEKGMALANRLEGVSAVIVDDAGAVHYSADLEPVAPAEPDASLPASPPAAP